MALLAGPPRSHENEVPLKGYFHTSCPSLHERPPGDENEVLPGLFSRQCLEGVSVLKNSFVPSSDACSEAQKPGSVVFWPGFLGVLDLFRAADRSDSDFFNSLTPSSTSF